MHFTSADGGVVSPLPGFQRGDGAGHALLPDFHATADAVVLEISGAHQIAPASDDACGRTAEEFMRAVHGHIRAALEKPAQIVFRSAIDDDGHSVCMRDLRHFFQRQLPVLHGVVRHDVQHSGGTGRDGAVELVRLGLGGLPHRHDPRSRQPHRLLHRCAVTHHVTKLNRDFVAWQCGGVGQTFDRGEIVTGHCSCNRYRDSRCGGGRYESGFGTTEPGDGGAGSTL